MKKKHRKKSYKTNNLNILAIPVLFACIIGLIIYIVVTLKPEGSKPVDSSNTSNTSESASSIDASNSITLTRKDIYKGDLILVNYAHAISDDLNPEPLINIYDDFKVRSFSLARINITLGEKTLAAFEAAAKDAKKEGLNFTVDSGYRSTQYQQDLYNRIYEEYLKTMTQTAAKMKTELEVALPTKSEHHTGLAVDISAEGSNELFENTPHAKWIDENCYKYGLIVRYKQSKTEITKIIYEPWHLRYVGKIHAKLIWESGLCFEEYHDYLKEKKSVDVTENGKKVARIVYVKANEVGDTKVPLEECKSYEVSGNNVDGFIITYYYE